MPVPGLQEPIVIGERAFTAAEVLRRLRPFVSDERRAKIDAVVAERTCTVAPVLDGLYDRGNVSAVLRSAEALGFLNVHVIDSSEKFKRAKRVTQGAEKWLNLHMWRNAADAADALRAQGYRILATHFDSARPVEEFAFDTPTAIVFGNEHTGVSPELLEKADARVVIPMPGFTQSFNISVAAALCLYHVRNDRRDRLGANGDLGPEARRVLAAQYYIRSVRSARAILLHQTRAQDTAPKRR